MVKVAIIGCQRYSLSDCAIKDLHAAENAHSIFAKIRPIEIIGYVSCGGCPGKRTVARASMLAKIGADIIALSSCTNQKDAEEIVCPYRARICSDLNKQFASVIILDGTY